MGEKIKYFVYALIPSIVINMIQALALMIVTVVDMSQNLVFGIGMYDYNDPAELVNFIMNNTVNSINVGAVLALYMVLAVICELLVARFVFKQKSLKGNIKNINGKAVGAIVLAIAGLGLITSIALQLVEVYLPGLMAKYEELINSIGLGENLTGIAIICAVIGAPIVEEICYRGFTQYLFSKVFDKFWVVNICQALIFGAVHGNIVQGTYAFCIGLVLGYIRKRYNTLYASILAHLFFNFYGTIITSLLGSSIATVSSVCLVAGGGLALYAGLKLMGTSKEEVVQ